MNYNLFSLTHPTARKDHRCIWCGGKIPKGADYVHESSVYDGEMQNHHWHPECFEYSRDVLNQMDWEFTPYDNERPEQPEESSEAERVKAGA